MHSTAESAPGVPQNSPTSAAYIGRFRWVICTLLLVGVTKNYMDRQVLGVLKTTLQHDLGWNEIDYSNIVFAFQLAYAVGLLLMGPFIDRVGTKVGYAFALVFWSVAAMAHAFAGSVFGFSVARIGLGLGESGNFPAAIKTTAEWFPRRERALATGIFNAGSNAGAIFAPALVPWMAITFGWRASFVFVALLGLVALAVILRLLPADTRTGKERFDLAGVLDSYGPLVRSRAMLGIYGCSLSRAIGLWLVLAPAIGAIARAGKSGKRN